MIGFVPHSAFPRIPVPGKFQETHYQVVQKPSCARKETGILGIRPWIGFEIFLYTAPASMLWAKWEKKSETISAIRRKEVQHARYEH
jgi:hypothetical protein